MAKKLGVKPGSKLCLLNLPDQFGGELKELSQVTEPQLKLCLSADVIVLFCKDAAELERSFSRCKDKLAQKGGLWVAWYKKASGKQTDLTDETVRNFGLHSGLVDNKVCALNHEWSGLRFVRRLSDRT